MERESDLFCLWAKGRPEPGAGSWSQYRDPLPDSQHPRHGEAASQGLTLPAARGGDLAGTQVSLRGES